jgi:hypothetical protein
VAEHFEAIYGADFMGDVCKPEKARCVWASGLTDVCLYIYIILYYIYVLRRSSGR